MNNTENKMACLHKSISPVDYFAEIIELSYSYIFLVLYSVE